jgi:DNA-binding NarL/FixJ family response regulator
MVRDALAGAVSSEKDCYVVRVSRSWETTRPIMEEHKPDVALVDVRLDGESGLDVARNIAIEFPSTRIVMLTSFASDEALLESHLLGASAFLLKSGSAEDLLNTIRKVAAGETLIDSVLVRAASENLHIRGVDELKNLDDTDMQIARLIALGYSDKQIAESVFLGLQTVRNRVSRLLSRFHKENRTQLALFFSEYLPD